MNTSLRCIKPESDHQRTKTRPPLFAKNLKISNYMTEKEIKKLLHTVEDDDWMLVISPNGQLKTVVMPKNKETKAFTMKQILAIADSGIEEAVRMEIEDEFPQLIGQIFKKTLH